MTEYPIVLAATTGRCGTTYLANMFGQCSHGGDHWVTHEHLKQPITRVGVFHRCYESAGMGEMLNEEIEGFIAECRSRANLGVVFDPGWTMRSLIPLFAKRFPDRLKVLHVHRHPVEVAASFSLIGSYSIYSSEEWAITPFHPCAKYPAFQERWMAMTPFERCLYLWLEVNSYALELGKVYPNLPVMDVPSSRLFSDDAFLWEVAAFSGFGFSEHTVEKKPREGLKNRKLPFDHETRPIKEEWRNFTRHPEVIELATSLGYDMSFEHVERLVRKYQLPPGFMPWVRNKTRYWHHRKRVGDLLRRAGLR